MGVPFRLVSPPKMMGVPFRLVGRQWNFTQVVVQGTLSTRWTCGTPIGPKNPNIDFATNNFPSSNLLKYLPSRINLHIGMSRQHLKIPVVVEDGYVNTDCDGSNETID